MFRRPPAVAVALTAALLAAPAGAGAQTRAVVVPEGAAVVVPPRGSALPRPAAAQPVARHRPRLPPMAPARDEDGFRLEGAGAVAAVALPAIAAAALATVLSNGSGGGGGNAVSGPVRTR